uniref:Sec16 Sec23-binding domain-containing protein n=1 Tax=Quercus lobata TaxID=97700 RepID=A0A7N2LYU8_QUELO
MVQLLWLSLFLLAYNFYKDKHSYSIQSALIVGDYKGAVAQCISANKMADALVIANVGGAFLWESTRDQYFKISRSPYLKVVSAMVNNDLLSLVNTRPLKFWKETLALLCSFAQREEWTMLCDTLASKLMTADNTLAATLCYICAGNIDKIVEIWSRSLRTEHEGKSYVELLQDLMEKTIVLALATGQKRFSASLCKLVEKYAEIVASQGLLTTAMEYLKLLGSDELSPELVILRDQIALATEPVASSHLCGTGKRKVIEKEARAMPLENSQTQSAAVYGADQSNYGYDTSQTYYQETAPSQMQPSVPSSPYGGNYQPPSSSPYGAYGTPAPYQPPNIFLPSRTPSQPNFAAPPVTAPVARPFIPTTPTMLKNVGQYQQPTLGSQLYPGTANPTYQPVPSGNVPAAPITSQPGSVPGHTMPHVVAPTPSLKGFMPVNSAVVQRSGMGSMQPHSPTQAASVQPTITPAAPPPTVQTVDTSNVPAKKREIEDNSRKLGALFAKLNSGDISKNASDKLVQLCQALDGGDFSTALQIQVLLTTSEWDECNFWLATLKRVIKTRQNVRIN